MKSTPIREGNQSHLRINKKIAAWPYVLPVLDSPNPVARRHAESNSELEGPVVPYTILVGTSSCILLMFRAATQVLGTHSGGLILAVRSGNPGWQC